MSCSHLHGDFQMFSNEIFFFLKKISNYSLEVLCEYFFRTAVLNILSS